MTLEAQKNDKGAKPAAIYGQWIGKFHGENPVGGNQPYTFPGNATVNIEYDRPNFGFACVDQGNQLHGSCMDFNLKVEGNRISGRSISNVAFDWKTSETITIEESVRRQGANIFYPNELVIEDGFIDQNSLICNWSGHHQSARLKGKFEGRRLGQNTKSECDKIMQWNDFKRFVEGLIRDGQESIFRGQGSNKHRLKTSFHRERRYDLRRYETETWDQLSQHISAITSRQYDRKNPTDFGALLSLAQHHGFPTPLLDWSKSPYIAAYFAFENRSSPFTDDDHHRVYILDAKKWISETTQAWHFADPRPAVTLREFLAHDNPRHLPQQSVHTYANVEDIEAWIRWKENENNKRYLTIIDIPHAEREFAMRDLSYMGVTAAALMPGFEGICRTLKERFFQLH